MTPQPEDVVLVDDAGHAVGTAPKSAVHHAETPLHLAFSCYVFDGRGRTLLTRRASGKRTWPDSWTNACCGHPLPGEPVAAAVQRRLRQELGLVDVRCDLVLPRFRYRAVMDNGVVENELCPVFRAVTDQQPSPDPDEVGDHRWVDWIEASTSIATGALEVSPWCVLQVEELTRVAADPLRWPTVPLAELPPAAR